MIEYKDVFTEYPDVVSVDDLTKMLHIGKNKAYELVSSNTIQNIRMGRKYIIPKFRVLEFLEKAH